MIIPRILWKLTYFAMTIHQTISQSWGVMTHRVTENEQIPVTICKTNQFITSPVNNYQING